MAKNNNVSCETDDIVNEILNYANKIEFLRVELLNSQKIAIDVLTNLVSRLQQNKLNNKKEENYVKEKE